MSDIMCTRLTDAFTQQYPMLNVRSKGPYVVHRANDPCFHCASLVQLGANQQPSISRPRCAAQRMRVHRAASAVHP
jgi:hypothetical protein